MSELTVVLLGSLIVSLCGLFRGVIRSKVRSGPFVRNPSNPLSHCFVPVDSLEPTSVARHFLSILSVLRGRTFPKIFASIIDCIPVSVISKFTGVAAKKKTVHIDISAICSSRLSPHRIKTVRVGIPDGIPIPLREPSEIVGVNDGVLALRERNKSVRFVERLRHFVSDNTSFKHLPTSSWNVLRSHSIIFAVFVLLLLCPSGFSQSTSTTINVTDAGGQAWANGTFTALFVGDRNAKWAGGNLARSFSGSLNASGSATQSLPDTNTITPSPSFWNISVCPNPAVTAGPSGCFLQQFTISGASQTVNITPPAIVITVPTTPTQINPVAAYADAEISGGWVGFSYYNVTSGTSRICQTVSGGSCTAWTAGSGGSITSYTVATLPASPAVGTLAQVTDAAFTGSCTSGGGSALALCRWTGSIWSSIGDGGGIGAVTPVFNAVTGYGLSATKTAAQNNTALTALSTAVNAYVPTGTNDYPIIYIPGGSASANGEYQYSGGLTITQPFTMLCGPGEMLNYTGSAHGGDFGATGVNATGSNMTKAQINAVFYIEGCGWKGGGSMTEGLFFNKGANPYIHNNRFIDFGNNGAPVWQIWLDGANFIVNFFANYVINDDNVARNGLRSNIGDGGNTQLHYDDNNTLNFNFGAGFPWAATNSGVEVYNADGIGAEFKGNNMAFCSPCIQVGSVSSHTKIINNNFEGLQGTASTVITYGDSGSGAAVDGLYISGSYQNGHSQGGLLAPAAGTLGTQTLTNARIENIECNGCTTPIVTLNDTAGNTGNSFFDVRTGATQVTPGQMATITTNNLGWTSSMGTLYLPDGTAGAPSLARAGATGDLTNTSGLRFTTGSGNDRGIEWVMNNGANSGYISVAPQNAGSNYAGFTLYLPNDPGNSSGGALPNAGFVMRHFLNSTLAEDAFESFENSRDITFYTTTSGTTAKKFSFLNNGGFALGAAGLHGTLLLSQTAPTIAAAGCGGAAASITVNNGTAAFKVGVGTTPGSACTITMPSATTGWNCFATDITTNSTSVFLQKQTGAESQTSVVITNFNDVAVATAFVASDVLKVSCYAD